MISEDLLAAEGEAQFDVICAMEIIEHVSDVLTFVQSVTKLLKVFMDSCYSCNLCSCVF